MSESDIPDGVNATVAQWTCGLGLVIFLGLLWFTFGVAALLFSLAAIFCLLGALAARHARDEIAQERR